MYTGGDRQIHYLIKLALNGLSLGFKTLSYINLKRKSLFRRDYPDATVVSIDNLSFGGTGKTALVMEIGRELSDRGIPFAVVTRGYRAALEKKGGRVEATHTAAQVGDEAKMLKSRFLDRDIFIGRDRHRSIGEAVARGNSIILLDDGFQSTDIGRDFKIMLFNPDHPFYYLRNFKCLAKDEDVILFHRPLRAAGKEFLPDLTKRYFPGAQGKVRTGCYHFELSAFTTPEGVPVTVGRKGLLGFSALGDNARFKADLDYFNLVEFEAYRDHYPFNRSDLEWLDQRRRRWGASYLVCTEKDFWKLKDHNLDDIPLIYVKNVIKCSFDLVGTLLDYAEKKSANKTKA